ncbi:MAG: hypothetical protein ABIO36_01465 [Pyrinomonadaceae bacterium]
MKLKILALAICAVFTMSILASAQDSMMKHESMNQDSMMKSDSMKKDTMMKKIHHKKRRHHRRHHRMVNHMAK